MTISQTISKFGKDERYLLIFGFLFITAVFSPYVYFGENIHTPIFDNLDSNIVWAKMVLDQGGPFLPLDTTMIQMMDGIPLSSLCPLYDISFLWFKLFGMFWGYVFSKYMVALIGFFGMYFLLKRHILPKDTPLYIPLVVSVFFALLPYWSFSAHVSGLPMVFYALLNFRQGDLRIKNWIFLFIYAFYSSLILTGVFVLLVMCGVLIRDWIKYKRFNRYLFLAIFSLSLMYVISHLPLFYSFFIDKDFVSHRVEFRSGGITSRQTYNLVIDLFIYSDMNLYGHAIALQKYMLPVILLALFFLIKKRIVDKKYIYLIIFILASCFFYGIWSWNKTSLLRAFLTELVPVDFSRFFWMLPLCWSLLFGLALYYLWKEFKWFKYLFILIIVVQTWYVIENQTYISSRKLPSYKEFYAETQFEAVKSFIGKDVSSYRVVSILLHPAISQYNGFYTVDGFSPNYPLSYKHRFRKIIQNELEKNLQAKYFFDDWGSHCYAYSGEDNMSAYYTYNNKMPTIQHLDFDYTLLKEMGCQYIISATAINMDNNPQLKFLKVFDNYKTSHWTIYLYEIK